MTDFPFRHECVKGPERVCQRCIRVVPVRVVQVDSPRAPAARAYLDERGLRLLAVLDEIAAVHRTTVAAVSLAWLVAQPTVVAAIASARSVEQLADLLPVARVTLSAAELERLDKA